MNNISPATQQAATALPLEAGHSQSAPAFSFDDEPLFEVNGSLHPDDFFSSPEWTDPSPALTMAMSFAVDSCDTSPLLTDNYDAPDMSGVPLFGDFYTVPPSSSSSSSLESYHSKRSPQNAFNTTKDLNEDSGILLLRALNKHDQESNNATMQETAFSSVPLTASPAAISSPAAAFRQPLLSSNSSSESLLSHGLKRRRDTTELLPMDAPIQPRKYLAPSKTSRRELLEFEAEADAEEADIRKEKDPLLAKRRSNTLAARRSRHRKAAELQELHDTIDELRKEKEMWKARCLRLEKNLEC